MNEDMREAVLTIALNLLSIRILTVLALLLDAGIFSWAMYAESWPRLAGATLFAVASYCLIYLRPQGEK